MTTTDEFLEHFGVKGMKWGVRNSDKSKSTYKDRVAELKNNSSFEPFTVKTKNGDTVNVDPAPQFKVAAYVNAISRKQTENTLKNTFMEMSVKGESVGDASMVRKSKDELYLNWLGVDDAHQGKGYGSAVFDAAVKHGRDLGVKKITLEVPGNAPDARHIYEKRGFTSTRELTPKEIKADPFWGGLTPMELDLSKVAVKHASSDPDSDEFEAAMLATFSARYPELNEAFYGVAKHGNVLEHYGTKGMKWGVRKDQHREYQDNASRSTEGMVKRASSSVQMTRYFAKGGAIKKNQKYDEEWYAKLETGKSYIEKGETLNRVVRGVDHRALSGRLYVSKLESDSDMYKAVIPAVQKKFAFGQKEYHTVYDVKLETKKKMTLPSEKERIDTFIETIKTPAGRQWMKDSGYKDEINELNAKEQGLRAYKKFNKVAGNQELPVTDAYFNKIKSKGYDAILDDNDAGIWSKEPMILLSPSSTVKVKSVKQLSADDINAAQRRVLAARDFKGGNK